MTSCVSDYMPILGAHLTTLPQISPKLVILCVRCLCIKVHGLCFGMTSDLTQSLFILSIVTNGCHCKYDYDFLSTFGIMLLGIVYYPS